MIEFPSAFEIDEEMLESRWYLATPTEFRSITHLFGIARCTAHVIVHETCKAIMEVLIKLYIVYS